MKRINRGWLLALMLAALLPLMAGCSGQQTPGAEAETVPLPAGNIAVDLEIKEKMFIAQTNEVYLNQDDYLGKTIKYEGMFYSSYYEPSDSTYYMVIRYGPGCCGNDGNVGFEVAWDEGKFEVPAEDAWVEVIGVLEEYEEGGATYLQLKLDSLRVMPSRGVETVTQ